MILGPDGQPISTTRQPQRRSWGDRRWEAADTTRLNSAHWQGAHGLDINSDLALRGHELRKRVTHELANNAIVRGMCETHKTDLIGAHGPRLDVVAIRANGESDDAYDHALEDLWREWWSRPDLNGELSGVDWLRQNVEMLWQCGEFIAQLVTTAGRGPVKVRLHAIHPKRIGSDMAGAASMLGTQRDMVMGIERSRTGRALYYHLDDSPPGAAWVMRSKRISARHVIHEFRRDEPGQVRGVPWLASALQAIADLRDYDDQVLDAARAAADYSAMLVSDHPDIEPIQFDSPETIQMERRTVKTAPPGWKITQMTPAQPATSYVEYRRERHRDIGRPIAMPAMIARLDSSAHNFSSARFDGQSYDRANAERQAWLERNTMNRLVDMVRREGELSGDLPAPPPSISYRWSWGVQTHMAGDPQKEARAAETRMQNNLSTLSDELAKQGKDLTPHLAQLEREARMLRHLGLLTATGESSEGGASIERMIADLFRRAIDEYESEREEAS